MPRGNGTGPRGMGQMTGQCVGFCTGNEKTGYENPQIGRGIKIGFRGGRGFAAGGRGWRNCFYASGLPGWVRFGGSTAGQESPMRTDPEMEKQNLSARIEALEMELALVKKRLVAMDDGAGEGQ